VCDVVRPSQSMAIQVRSIHDLRREGVTLRCASHFPSSPLAFNPRSRRYGRVVCVPIASPPRSRSRSQSPIPATAQIWQGTQSGDRRSFAQVLSSPAPMDRRPLGGARRSPMR
jgi:hypothetical protein